jgi:two-component system response regulator VicR
MKAKILIVDDEPNQIGSFSLILRQEGYEVILVQDALGALYYHETLHPDLIILDIKFGYEERKGLDILKEIRELRNDTTTPIIVLTGLREDELEWISFKYGAIDFARKTSSTESLLARVKARLPPALSQPNEYNGYLKIDLHSYSIQVKRGDGWKDIHLKPQEFELLRRLVVNQGRVITREALYDLFPDAQDPDNTLNHNISVLRKTLEPDPTNPQYILTKRGIGYLFTRYK